LQNSVNIPYKEKALIKLAKVKAIKKYKEIKIMKDNKNLNLVG